MTFTRAVAVPKGISRVVFRRAGSSTRSRSWRQVSRRGYASDHGHGQQQSSEIPWIIGSAAVTIPAAAWLLGQTPKKSEHHGHEEHAEKDGDEEKEEQPEEESKEEKTEDEPKEESEDGDKSEDDSKPDSGDDKSEDSSNTEESSDEDGDGPSAGAPKQINWDSSKSKGPGEGQKGQREPSQKKGEKDAQGDSSGAKHPYLDDAEKSKKGVGVTETAKIHGTVDSRAGARGVGETGSGSS